jgi:hypothetical protein
MNYNDIIKRLLAMPNGARETIGVCDVRRDGTGDYYSTTTPRGFTAYYHASGMAAIVLSWIGAPNPTEYHRSGQPVCSAAHSGHRDGDLCARCGNHYKLHAGY